MKLTPKVKPNLARAIAIIMDDFKRNSTLIHRDSWQALDVSNKPEMATFELIGPSLIAQLGSADMNNYVVMVQPDLPWADNHFEERVSGKPLNPPPSEAWWPHSPDGNSVFKDEIGVFSHSYPERLWPKLANSTEPHRGIRYPYGDLMDVVNQLKKDPFTRQAYIPLFFPEDTGNCMDERVPCTLGWHLLRVENELHMFYYIRSVDLLRHFRNDVYMSIRLLLWVLEKVEWSGVSPGLFHMHISSLHCFRNDWFTLFGEHR